MTGARPNWRDELRGPTSETLRRRALDAWRSTLGTDAQRQVEWLYGVSASATTNRGSLPTTTAPSAGHSAGSAVANGPAVSPPPPATLPTATEIPTASDAKDGETGSAQGTPAPVSRRVLTDRAGGHGETGAPNHPSTWL